MTSEADTRCTVESPALRLGRQEWLFLVATILFWGLYALWLGKETSWDFRNYHWYIPYAFLNGREGLDMVVAHHATYYNPLQDIPFYLLATHAPAWCALLVLGLVQGTNVVPLYILGRQMLCIERYKLGAAALALLGQTGGFGLSMFGTTYYDNVMSVFILSSLAILVVQRERMREGALWQVAAIAAVGGFLTGSTVGLKLPEAPFAIGFAAALVALGGDWRHQLMRLLAGGLGGVLGVAIFMGYWAVHLAYLTGNPLFPYFNDVFHSPLALPATYRDVRFLPHDFWIAVAFPILFSLDWRIAADIPFHDIRVMLAYVTAIVAMFFWVAGRRSKDPLVMPGAAWPVLAFAAMSYLAWLSMFAIYRYILALELLGPLIVAIAIGLLPIPRRIQIATLAVLCVAMITFTDVEYIERAPISEPFVSADVPKIAHSEKAMILLTGTAPLGFIAPSLPPAIALLRIDGYMVQPNDGTTLTRSMQSRVQKHMADGGDVYLLADAHDLDRARNAVAGYSLQIKWSKCVQFGTNIVGKYAFCPLLK